MTPDLREAVTDLLLNAGCGDSNECEAIADEILSLPALSVPEGWVAVPRELDHQNRDHNAALAAGMQALRRHAVCSYADFGTIQAVFQAVASAIPSPGGEGNV